MMACASFFPMRGKRIRTLEQLERAALDRKAVSAGMWCKRIPAAVVLFMQANEVLRLFEGGMWIYKPKAKR